MQVVRDLRVQRNFKVAVQELMKWTDTRYRRSIQFITMALIMFRDEDGRRAGG